MKEHNVVELTSHVCITCAKQLATKEDLEDSRAEEREWIIKNLEKLPNEGDGVLDQFADDMVALIVKVIKAMPIDNKKTV